MVSRSFFIVVISLFLLSFPGYSFAAEEHSGHGSAPVSSPASHGGGYDQHGTGSSGHDSMGSNGHSSDNSGHGGQDEGHGNSGNSSLEPVKNLLVGGFAGLNALIIAIAAFFKVKLQRGVAG